MTVAENYVATFRPVVITAVGIVTISKVGTRAKIVFVIDDPDIGRSTGLATEIHRRERRVVKLVSPIGDGAFSLTHIHALHLTGTDTGVHDAGELITVPSG